MPILETKTTRAQKKGANAYLSFYRDKKQYVHTLWVTRIEQPHQVSGARHQSQHQAHWYPKSYQPGDISVTVRCRTQEDYQRLANLVRLHHRTLLETPGLRFSGKKNSTGLRHLMLFRVQSEAISVRGWIPSFTISKKGVFDVAPECTFAFFTAIDPYSSDPIISHQIREWWNPNKLKPVKDPFEIDPEQGKPGRKTEGNQAGDFGGVGGQ
jgi:hypothetical protein